MPLGRPAAGQEVKRLGDPPRVPAVGTPAPPSEDRPTRSRAATRMAGCERPGPVRRTNGA
jgi:hypothetical protein